MGEVAQKQEHGSAIERAGGTFHGLTAINERLAALEHFKRMGECHLLTQSTRVSFVPEGYGIAITTRQLDPARDGYNLPGGQVAPRKHALENLANDAGVSFIPERSGCTERGLHVYGYRAVAEWTLFDGRKVVKFDEVVIDLRDGSPAAEEILSKARTAESGRTALMQARKFIERHAVSKARLRVIRQLGMPTSFAREDFVKPFVCVSLQVTGYSSDPELRREMTMAKFNAAIGASRALYGEAARSAVTPLALATESQSAEDADPPDFIDAETGEVHETRPTPAPSAPKAERTRELPASRQGEGSAVLRFGRAKGTPIDEANDSDLEWYAGALRKSVADPEKARFRRDNEADLRAVEDELRRRSGEASEEDEDSWLGERE